MPDNNDLVWISCPNCRQQILPNKTLSEYHCKVCGIIYFTSYRPLTKEIYIYKVDFLRKIQVD